MTTSGPYFRHANNGRTYVYRMWYRQKPPFGPSGRPPNHWVSITALTTRSEGPRVSWFEVANSPAGDNAQHLIYAGPDRTRAFYKAYQRFVSKVNEEAMLIVNAAERKEAGRMLANSANRMLFAFQLLQRGRRASAMKALGLKPKGKKWNRAVDASNLWLEYHFGWEPLIKDIHSAVEILQSNPSPRVARGSGKVTSATGSYVIPYSIQGVAKNKLTVRLQATVSVTNPNLHKASQLGLINPASVAWELIPFSFLVDWFIPVGNFLNSYTDFVGLELENAFTTTYLESESFEWMDQRFDSLGWTFFDSKSFAVSRILGIDVPPPTFTLPQGISLVRGATAIALLIGAFRNQLNSDKTRMRL